MHVIAIRLADGEELWRYDWAGEIRGDPRIVALRNKRLFLATEVGLFVLDSRKGELLRHVKGDWKRERYPGCMVVENDGNRIYMGDMRGDLRYFTLDEGRELWNARPFDHSDSLAMHDGRLLFFGSHDGGGLILFSAQSGEVLWRRRRLPRVSLLAETGPMAPPLIAGGRILLPVARALGPFDENRPVYLMALHLDTGKLAWKSRLGNTWPGAMASDGARVYAVDYDDELLCFDLRSGRRIWKTKDLRAWGDPIVSGETVVLLTEKGVLLRGLSVKNGDVLWDFDFRKEGVDFAKEVIISGSSIVVVGSKGEEQELLLLRPVEASVGRKEEAR